MFISKPILSIDMNNSRTYIQIFVSVFVFLIDRIEKIMQECSSWRNIFDKFRAQRVLRKEINVSWFEIY